MRGEISSSAFDKRHPYDWYVEEHWVTGQLIRLLDGFAEEAAAGEAIWDPCCGMGNVARAFEGTGWPNKVWLSDIVDRVERTGFSAHPADRIYTEFFGADFREIEAAPSPCSLVFNPPYSYVKGIAEAFVRHALRLTSRRVCALLPVKWLSSQARYRLFTEFPPAAVVHLTQRPSMPPGDRIKLMGSRAFRGGMIDYCWIVWNVQRPVLPGQTRTIWLPPLGQNSLIKPEVL